MSNKPNTKKQWQAPKIIDLDVKKTKSGSTWSNIAESVAFSYSYYSPAPSS